MKPRLNGFLKLEILGIICKFRNGIYKSVSKIRKRLKFQYTNLEAKFIYLFNNLGVKQNSNPSYTFVKNNYSLISFKYL